MTLYEQYASLCAALRERECESCGGPAQHVAAEKLVKFKEWTCLVEIARYFYGGLAICLFDAETGEAVATATINVDRVRLEPDEVIIKDYSENEGMLDALVSAGIVEDTGKRVPLPYVDAPVCRLLVGVEES